MKKTISINISGVVFNIEDDAYDDLKSYLDTISGYFTDSDGRAEIMMDIESRIAELFQEGLHDNKNVVSMADVEQVIDIMGRPEDYLGDEDEPQRTRSGTYARSQVKRRLYRDSEKGLVGGVCAGISHYFGWDPIWIRLALVIAILSAGVGLVVYLILWIIMPAARTTSEKLEMMGEPVTVDSIKKKVNETIDSIKAATGSPLDTEFQANYARDQVSRGGNLVVDILKRLLQFIGRFLGFIFLLGGLALLAFLTYSYIEGTWFQSSTLFMNADIFEIKDLLFTSDLNTYTFLIGLALVTLIPILGLTLLGIWLLFSIKSKTRALVPSMIVFWIMGIVMLAISGIGLGKEFAVGRYTAEKITLTPNSDTIYIDVKEDPHFSNSTRFHFNRGPNELMAIKGDSVFCGFPELRIVQSLKDRVEIEVERRGRGFTSDAALKRAESVDYSYRFEGDTLLLDSFFKYAKQDKFRAQELEITLRIPRGQRVYLGDGLSRILCHASSAYNVDTEELVGKEWIMTNDGLIDESDRDESDSELIIEG